jgi:hypothetical protein
VLFGYPIAATAENWLHECLCAMVQMIHTSHDAGQSVPAWPDIIPTAHRGKLRTRTGLRKLLNQYSAAARKLSVPERQQVLTCLVQQNRIPDLVTCSTDCESLTDLPVAIRAPTAALFDFAFILLTPLGVRDRHYHAIYTAASYHVCPFCGCEYFDAPGAPREDLDHYLSKSRYPFAAANLRNLVPMGMKCNERYKQAQDILRDTAGARRRSFDPYADRQIKVALDNSVPFGGADGQTPDWQIDFGPNSVECTTWDDVFHVRERIKRDVLDSSFWQWLRDFSAWFKKRMGIADPGDAEVLDAMRTYAEDMALTGLTAREFLRAPVFQMLHRHCEAGDQRVLALMKDVVAMAVPPAAAAGIAV